jgi:hypothetical protein
MVALGLDSACLLVDNPRVHPGRLVYSLRTPHGAALGWLLHLDDMSVRLSVAGSQNQPAITAIAVQQ